MDKAEIKAAEKFTAKVLMPILIIFGAIGLFFAIKESNILFFICAACTFFEGIGQLLYLVFIEKEIIE